MTPCMGGWCARRGQCPHYSAAINGQPVERLCLPRQDGVRLVEASAFRTVLVDVFTGRQISDFAKVAA